QEPCEAQSGQRRPAPSALTPAGPDAPGDRSGIGRGRQKLLGLPEEDLPDHVGMGGLGMEERERGAAVGGVHG
ncbi:MAG: hypothetical protein ACRD03_14795, partial [Acidimicrobiales bacterium]